MKNRAFTTRHTLRRWSAAQTAVTECFRTGSRYNASFVLFVSFVVKFLCEITVGRRSGGNRGIRRWDSP
jgi:hypothetical protein